MKRASDYPPEVLELFDSYVHNAIDRRTFLERAAKFGAALAFLEGLSPNYALAEQVKPTDKRIATESIDFPSPKGTVKMRGYLARPAKVAKAPGVLVIHENRGLNPYIEDVARRLAVEGYIAFAPDALASVGGYPGDEDKAKDLFAKLDPDKRSEDMLAAADVIKARATKVGAIGFCYGGGVCNLLASKLPWLAAAVPFYGTGVPADEAAKIKAPMQMHFAENDDRVNGQWPAYKAALEANKIRFEAFTYAKTQHGFHNDTTPRYDEAAAKLAWKRALAHFKKYLY